MMNAPLYLFLIYVLSLISYLLLLTVFRLKPSVRFWILGIGVVLCLAYGYYSQNALRIIPSALAFLCAFASLRGSLISNLHTFSLIFLLNECITGIWGCLFIMIYTDTSDEIPTVLLEYILSIITYLIIIAAKYALAAIHPNKSASYYSPHRIRLSYISVIVMAISLILTVSVLKHLINPASSDFMWYFTLALIILAYLGIGGVAILFDFTLTSNQNMKEMLQQEQLNSDIMKGYNQALLDQDNAIRTYRHDINNHLLSLQHLISSNDTASAEDYLHSMITGLSETNVTVVPTGNTLVDAISNYYIGLLPSRKIFHLRAALPEVLPIDSYSFTTIYANLLQNAVEAVLSQASDDTKTIFVTLRQTDHFLQAVIENTYTEHSEKQYIHNSSSKLNHGFGLTNVKKTIITLNGSITLNADAGMFKVAVALPIASDKST